MKADIISIGNSKGVRIPKALLEQCGFGASVDIALESNRLVLSAAPRLRAGWDDAFKAMAAENHDLPPDETANDFDQGEWQW